VREFPSDGLGEHDICSTHTAAAPNQLRTRTARSSDKLL